MHVTPASQTEEKVRTVGHRERQREKGLASVASALDSTVAELGSFAYLDSLSPFEQC